MKDQQDDSIERERQSLDGQPQQLYPTESSADYKRSNSQLPIHGYSTLEVIKHGDKANDHLGSIYKKTPLESPPEMTEKMSEVSIDEEANKRKRFKAFFVKKSQNLSSDVRAVRADGATKQCEYLHSSSSSPPKQPLSHISLNAERARSEESLGSGGSVVRSSLQASLKRKGILS
ncbi:MAG: hypothetical protein F6J93_08070 [Oscillatoria sp. SIO1A7]|nr:hypothetical protein [Oscillatoria sp. SIO1A7]